ncbi:hypothetical protein H0A36_13380 [Endozoicomonas sp. SM1973]|uniref:Uncharacterized protein n=1 Tax=Spartinivicinus marinus TaxID=2994442 RepID=A0A853IHF1_9GAMM|nr:hypothetical protein [Spartinivicinus marinus]MCX4027010.1 hypothetical protein [Spartinivicinus marinus]NYZ67006.1 hypothetical protein [Spartinivicinus marinus]
MTDQNDRSLEDLQRYHQLLEETLAASSQQELIQLIHLLSSTIGHVRYYQTQEQKEAEARQRVLLTQQVQQQNAEGFATMQAVTLAGIKEVLSALQVLKQQS